MKTKLNAKGKLLKVAEGKLKYHMSQNSMVNTYSVAYVGFSKGTINSICKLIDENKWSLDDIKTFSEEKCDSYLRPNQTKDHSKKVSPDFEDIHTKLVKDKSMTLFFLWRKYCAEQDDPYSYSRYCELYAKWCHLNKKAPVLVMNEVPGENCYIDWLGDKLEFCFDGEHIETVHFFVTSIGMSGYPYCEAFLNEKIESFIKGHIHAFEYYGGLPKYW